MTKYTRADLTPDELEELEEALSCIRSDTERKIEAIREYGEELLFEEERSFYHSIDVCRKEKAKQAAHLEAIKTSCEWLLQAYPEEKRELVLEYVVKCAPAGLDFQATSTWKISEPTAQYVEATFPKLVDFLLANKIHWTHVKYALNFNKIIL